jgi:class 3 adenylate cyclase
MSVAAGERVVISVLVADVVGSTSIAEKIGPERSKYLFDDAVRLMREEVERFGGTVAQLTGDGVLALFGAPTAHENDSERAVCAAVEIRRALADYNGEVASAYGLELGARVAVNTGPVVVPTSESPPDVLYNALGDTVNVAARLQSYGDLVLGPTTAHQVEDWFEFEPLGELELKGRSEKVAAFRLVGVRERPRPQRDAPLVGRRRERAEIADVFEALAAGRGGIVSVTGEPGIGKSRLVGEAEELFGDQVRFLVGHAVPYAETIPYWPVREQLRSWLGLGVSDPEARVRLELHARLAGTLADEADDAYPFLATLLGLTLEPEVQQRIAAYAGDVVQRETFDWLYHLVLTLAAESPLCLVLEDLHWSDEATLSLLDELLPAAERAPVVFVLIHRSDPEHPAWRLIDRARRRFPALFRELPLEPLSETEARELAESGAGGEMPDDLARRLAELTGGNPYFVGEALRDLRERGALREENGSVIVVGETTIPAALQETLQARVDRLDGDARELITTAAVIGRSFGVPLLERVLPRVRLLPTLSELQWLELVVEEETGSASEYRFRHGLVQEVAYGMLLDAHRRALHGTVAEALVELHRESPSEVYGLLGHHFAEAGDAERAIEYLMKAGDAARAVYADSEAIELYRRALSFMARDDTRARETLLRIGLTHHLAFDFGAANRAFAEAFSLPPPPAVRVAPSERVVWAVPAAWDRVVVPGLSWTKPAWQVGINLFRGLLSVGREMDIAPDLAERFSVSDDGRLYRFTLRRDAVWSDGVPVTVGDVVFTFERLVADGVPSAFPLKGVKATAADAQTLELRLAEPHSAFLYALTLPSLFPWPRHVVERDGPDWHRAVPLVGNGAFLLNAPGRAVGGPRSGSLLVGRAGERP